MDYALNEDQAALVSALQSVLARQGEVPQAQRLSFNFHDVALQNILEQGGFLEAGREMGPLEAALVVIETSRLPVTVETGVSCLVAPMVAPDVTVSGPIAIVPGNELSKAQRNLAVAKSVLVELDEDVVIIEVEPGAVEPVESIYAYPYGRFLKAPDLKKGRRIAGAADRLRQWRRVALAAEFAGAAQSAVDFTVDYVKQRHVFGKPIGAYQAVQHRLVQCHQVARGAYFLTLRAAWSQTPEDADLAACYAQQHTQKLIFDLHQFNGAMGVTTEHLLHFWTYRLRALQAEAGGTYGAALDLADKLWGSAETPKRRRKS